MSVATAENRNWPRHEVSVPVSFCTEMLEFDAEVDLPSAEVTDASLGGVFVRSDYLEPSGTNVRLRVQIPGRAEPLVLSGRVVWVSEAPPRGPGMGVRLDEGSDVTPVLEQAIAR